uniref:Lysozyme inhibitor LprI N-terminal domain-containing protein n=1 Tax=uncultured bacterium BLR7 TaxID=506523 RepID=C0INQ4_9BACT|nr:hypothetical protein AKSOIL_0098 [uncultured bacterium BLR7]
MGNRVGIAVVAAACVASGAFAANWADNTDPAASGFSFTQSKDICRSLKALAPPPADLPNAVALSLLDACDSEALYFGIGMPADPVKAKHCAYVEMGRGGAGAFKGAALLTSIYANGRGASQDLDLATSFACQLDGAPAEMTYRIMHLQQFKRDAPQVLDFSWCDDITTNASDALCTAHAARMASAQQMAKVSTVAARWRGPAGQGFQTLRRASQSYIAARLTNELDTGARSRAPSRGDEDSRLAKQFADRVLLIADGRPPLLTMLELQEAEMRMAALLENIAANPDFDFGTVSQQGVRETQTQWIAYRDAWLDFLRRAYPKMPPDSMRAWLTLRRIEELERFEVL